MKRQAERELSPNRALVKRARERDRERAREERGGLLPRPASILPKNKPEPPVGGGGGGGRSASGLEYKTLLISNLGSQVTDEHVEDGLFHEFKKFGDMSVKLSHTPELGRIAYVNFRQTECAREARHAKSRLVLYDRPLKVEPMYVRRRSPSPPEAAPYVPVHVSYPYRQRSVSPGTGVIRDARARHYVEALTLRERERVLDYYAALEDRARAYVYPLPEDDLMPEDDQRATRNLFIGNLDHNVSEPELRQGFDKFGIIEEVVIKRPARGQGCAYAFLKFQNLDMAHRAKVAMQGRVFGGNQVKIGYGKANPTTRLWVGGLGPNTSLAALAREFDRFGSIRTIDYVKGENFAYVHYESLDAAQAACTQMRGFPLGGAARRLRVDFAKAAEDPRAFPPLLHQLPPQYEILADSYRSLEREIRARPRSPSHALFTEREREWSPGKTAAVAVAFGRSRDRHAKGWEERRKRRSRTRSRSLSPGEPFEDRGRLRVRSGRPPTPEESPDRVRERLPDSTSDPPNRTPDGGRHHADERHHAPDSRNNRKDDPEPDSRSEKPKSEPKKPATLSEYAQTLSRVWHGSLVLKNSLFPASLHLLDGGANFFLSLLKDHPDAGRISQLKIAQRLRLDQPKLDEVTRRIRLGGPDGYTVLLAVQGPMDGTSPAPDGLQKRFLRNLVTYLRSKQAAGVIGLPLGGAKEGGTGGMLYAFPPCEFSEQFLQDVHKTLGKIEEEHLVVVVVRDTTQV